MKRDWNGYLVALGNAVTTHLNFWDLWNAFVVERVRVALVGCFHVERATSL
jgi:hypothetical protein